MPRWEHESVRVQTRNQKGQHAPGQNKLSQSNGVRKCLGLWKIFTFAFIALGNVCMFRLEPEKVNMHLDKTNYPSRIVCVNALAYGNFHIGLYCSGKCYFLGEINAQITWGLMHYYCIEMHMRKILFTVKR